MIVPLRRTFVTAAVCALATGCGGSAAPTPAGLAGHWSGTTSQGRTISFTISPDEKVTSITVEYSFSGCSGTRTFSNLNLETAPDVRCIPGPCPPGVSSFRSFNYSEGSPLDGPATSVNALFVSPSTAEGRVMFQNYPECGTTMAPWSARRQ